MPIDEASLVKQARSGSEDAFVTLYRRHRAPLFRFVWRMTGSVEAAEDVTQECFLTLAAGSGFNASRGELRTYLFGIARHLVFRGMKISTREEEEAVETASERDVLDDLIAAERSELVRQAVESLPALQREAVILFEYEGLTLQMIASITGVEVGAIKARLQRARESLRKRLGPLLDRNNERSCS